MQTTIDWLRKQEAIRVKVGVTDVDGVLRTKYLSAEKVVSSLEKGFGFCNVIFGWDSQDALYPHQPDGGFADLAARIIPESRRNIPWENDLPFLLTDFSEAKHPVAAACPRSLLIRVLSKAKKMGFTARFGPEFEWFTYRETPNSLTKKGHQNPAPLTPGMFGYSGLRTSQHADFYQDLFDQLAAFNTNIEGLHTETGPGVMEAALSHQEALEAADRAVLFKQGVKSISYRHGLLASFMAKPSADLPGCGGHLHQSLWREGENVFFDGDGKHQISKTMRQYVAGQQTLLPYLMPLFAPNVNSYKRYVAGSWAATRANAGIDNRTVALRIIPGGMKSTRLETRVPGADVNPYLAIAGALAAGLYGIEHKLKLPTKLVKGSAYDQTVGLPLPQNLGAAAGAMKGWKGAGDLLGRGFSEHFIRTREWEWQEFLSSVTDWERRRYFESA
ncbi:MAG: glutamine synthetase family protein [Lewinella sp.]